MKIYIVLASISLLFGCSANNIVGKYTSTNYSNRFQFKADSTFLYEWGEGHLYKFSSGTWKMHDKSVAVLNSYIQNTTIPITVDEQNSSDNYSLLSIDFRIIGTMKLSDYKCQIFINNELYLIKRCDSLTEIQIGTPIQDVYFHIQREPLVVTSSFISYPLFTEEYKPRNNHSNLYIKATINDSLVSYEPMRERKIIVKHNKIRLVNASTKRWETLSKVSDSKNIFMHSLSQ